MKFWREKTFEYVLRYLLTDNNESSDHTAEPSAKKRKVDEDEDDWLSDIIGAGGKEVDDQNQDEVHSYDSEPASNSNLSWWKNYEHKNSKLARLAKKYLCILASSVSSERIFSLAGNIINKKRCRLSPDMVDMLVFLNKNRK